MQDAFADRKIGPGRNDIEVVVLDRHSFGCLPDRHRCGSGQQVDHHAFMRRIEMLNEDEGHAIGDRKRADELPASLETAGGRANADNREIERARWRTARRTCTRARRRGGCLDLTWSIVRHSANGPSREACPPTSRLILQYHVLRRALIGARNTRTGVSR